MTQSFDILKDQQKLYRLDSLYHMPDFVKSATTDMSYNTNRLPDQAFADPDNKQFPVYNSAVTWLSYADFCDSRNNINEKKAAVIEHNLLEYGKFHGISAELQRVKSLVKVAEDTTDYALTITTEDGQVKKMYPLRNSDEVKAAAAYIDKHIDSIPYSFRQQMARNILNKTDEYEVKWSSDESTFLDRQAGYGTCAAEDIANLLKERVIYIQKKDASLAQELEKAASIVLEHPTKARTQSETRDGVINLIAELDEKYGLDRLYDGKLERPENVFNRVTEKIASNFIDSHFSTTTGNIYHKNDFTKLSLQSVKDVFGDDIADSISDGGLLISPTKAAEVIATLPRPDMLIMDKLIYASGISPVAKEASHTDSWLTDDKLQELITLKE